MAHRSGTDVADRELLAQADIAGCAFETAFVTAGIGLFFMAKKGIDAEAEGALMASATVLVAFCGIGLIGMVIAFGRLRWKREYERVMGRSPWSPGT